MKSEKALLTSALLVLTLFGSQAAEPADQAGGVPSLGARVGGLEITVEDQGARVGALEITVEDQGMAGAELGIQVEDLQTQVSTALNDLLILEGKLLFAVVDADGTRRASRGVQSAGHSLDGSGNPVTGHYDVVFSRNVSLCAVTVTAEPLFSGQVTASVNGTSRGSPIHDPNRFHIVVSDGDNNRVDSRFNIIVMC